MAPDDYLVKLADLLRDLDFLWKLVDGLVRAFVVCGVGGFARSCSRLRRELVRYAQN